MQLAQLPAKIKASPEFQYAFCQRLVRNLLEIAINFANLFCCGPSDALNYKTAEYSRKCARVRLHILIFFYP